MSKSRKWIELKEKNYSQVKKKAKKKQNRIPLSITYNRTVPNKSKIMNRNYEQHSNKRLSDVAQSSKKKFLRKVWTNQTEPDHRYPVHKQ